jgi:hypothetical protein
MKYGEFIDAMEQVAQINFDAKFVFEEWHDMATDEQWQEYRELPLGEGEVRNFVEDMATGLQKVLSYIDGEELYAMTLEDGHAFLQAIQAKCIELGIDISNIQIDVPLSPSDAIRMAQD